MSACAVLGVLLGSPRATGQCAPTWQTTFGGSSGVGGTVFALAAHDDGNGEALFAGGQFTLAGGVPALRMARWNGSIWSPLGGGMNGVVRALVEFDDGGGTQLYAAGDFTQADGAPASRIARWDGAAWWPLGAGLDGDVRALAVFDDGTGLALYAGGNFSQAGGAPASRIARWDGSAWSALGAGLNNWVFSLAVHDDGSGEKLYVGGDFNTAGGLSATFIARWNGSAWSAVGAGTNNFVLALAEFDDGRGGGHELYAGGGFSAAGGAPAPFVARWNGSAWSTLGSGMDFLVHAMTVWDDGSGEDLYLAGAFTSLDGLTTNRIARWDGDTASALGDGMNGFVNALAVHRDDGDDFDDLFAGGSFTTAGPVTNQRMAVIAGCPPPPWTDEGHAVEGSAGAPVLVGTGDLSAGSLNSVDLSNAAPSAVGGLFLSFSSSAVKFKGGALLPFPYLSLTILVTDGTGAFPIPFVMPGGAPPGVEIWLQWAIQDGAAPQGVALSNAVRGITP